MQTLNKDAWLNYELLPICQRHLYVVAGTATKREPKSCLTIRCSIEDLHSDKTKDVYACSLIRHMICQPHTLANEMQTLLSMSRIASWMPFHFNLGEIIFCVHQNLEISWFLIRKIWILTPGGYHRHLGSDFRFEFFFQAHVTKSYFTIAFCWNCTLAISLLNITWV